MPEPTKSPAEQKSPKATRKAPPVVKRTAPTKKTAAPTPKATRATNKAAKVRQTAATSEERHRLIAEAAYYRAEQRGFQGGSPEQDWIEAAAQVDSLFMS